MVKNLAAKMMQVRKFSNRACLVDEQQQLLVVHRAGHAQQLCQRIFQLFISINYQLEVEAGQLLAVTCTYELVKC